MPDVIRSAGQMHVRVPGTVAKAATKQIPPPVYSSLSGTEGQRCDNSPKIADETNGKILAQVCVGFNYIT